jgi:uncharacterized membrane protein YjjP (DUF1212 family)
MARTNLVTDTTGTWLQMGGDSAEVEAAARRMAQASSLLTAMPVWVAD